MPDKPKCPVCGAELPSDSPGGQCMECLLRLGLPRPAEKRGGEPLPSEIQPLPNAPPDPWPNEGLNQGSGDANDVAAVTEGSGDRIGRYKLLKQIGKGGMGMVYLAEQQEPVIRKVALKIIILGMDTREVVARFEAERQALALMDHPNIAKVLDAGATETGRPYFVMELVRGINITDYCDQNNLSTRERLDLFLQVCRAIQHAHQKGIIHRDIKPSNILVTLYDNLPVPKVIDFGIAKATAGRLTDQTLFTAFEQFMGTTEYMSPEQAEMSGLDVDTRSDVYSLGVLLYELLTGRTPFDRKKLGRAAIDEVRRIIREEEPPRPSTSLTFLENQDLTTTAKKRHTEPDKLLSLIRGDLDWIVMKTLEKDRTRRYETANDLAMDIQHHLHNEPILARPAGPWERAVKWARRRPAAAALTGVLAAGLLACTAALAVPAFSWLTKGLVVAGSLACAALAAYAYTQSVVATRKANEAARARQRAETSAREAEAAYARVAETLDEMDLSKADALFRADDTSMMTSGAYDVMTAVAYLGRVLRRSPGNRVAAARLMDTFCRHSLPLPITTIQLDTPLRLMTFSENGRQLGTISADGIARVWDPSSGKPLSPPMQHDNEVNFITFTKDADRLVTVVGESSTTREARPIVQLGEVRKVSGVQVWDARTGHQISVIMPPSGLAHHIAGYPDRSANLVICPAGRRIFLTTGSGQLQAWSADTGNVIGDFRPCKRARPVAISGDGRLLLVKGPDVREGPRDASTHTLLPPRFFVLDAATGGLRYRLVQQTRRRWELSRARFSADSRYLFDFAYSERSIRVVTAETGAPLAELSGHFGIGSEDPFASNRLQVSGNSISVVGMKSHIPPVESLRIEGIDFARLNAEAVLSPDGSKLATRSKENVIQIWDVRPGLPRYESFFPDSLLPQIGSPWVSAPTLSVFSRDGTFVAFAFSDHKVRIFDMTSARLLTDSVAHEDAIRAMHFNADGHLLATASADGTARVWDARTGKAISSSFRHETDVTAALFNPEGNRVMTVTQSGVVRIWDINSNRSIGQAMQHADAVLDAHWSPDGGKVVSASADGKARIWTAETGQLLSEANVHAAKVSCVRFSPNGKYLATASSDKTARIWDVAAGTPITPPMAHDAAVLFVVFSPDGLKLATVAADRTARIWDTHSGKPLTGLLKHKARFTTDRIDNARFLENGLWMATGGGAPRVWDVRTGHPLTGALGTEPWSAYSGCSIVERPNGLPLASLRHGAQFVPFILAPLPIPAWLPSWAESASGLRIGDRGEVEQVSFGELSRLREELMETPDKSEYARWAKWYFADRASRQINPYSQVSVSQFVGPTMENSTAGMLWNLSPTDASTWAKSARSYLSSLRKTGASSDKSTIQSNLVQALIDSERALRISPDESEAWQARAEFWREIGNVAEAFEAVSKADKLNPNNAELWSLRASLLELRNSFDDALHHYSRAVALAESRGPAAKSALNEILLRRSRLFRRLNRPSEAQADFLRAKNIPARDSQPHPNLIDLTSYYNGSLTEDWLAPSYDVLKEGIRFPRSTTDLSEVPRGVVTLGDVTFDVRGLIQVGAASPTGENYPTEVTGISVGRTCHRLHFLHSAIFADDTPEGTQIGSYLIHYENGRSERVPILIGESLADCFTPRNKENQSFTIAWTGRNAESRRQGTTIRLFKSIWQNPAPTETIRGIDFVFNPPGPAAPFLVAITAE